MSIISLLTLKKRYQICFNLVFLLKMNSHSVVVVDDDPEILELLQFNLQIRGYTVDSFSNGKEALDTIFDEEPDLVILDVIMPDLDGWEILKILRDHFNEHEIKILMLTAKSTDRDKLIGKSILKADDYITKPFDLSDLLKTVKKLLGGTDDENT